MTRACLFGENPLTMLEEEFQIDPYSRALVVVPREIIARTKGKFFNLSGTIDNLPDSGATAYFLAKAPVGTCMDLHQLALGTTAGPVNVMLYESPTVTSVGTPMTPVNQNRLVNSVGSTQVWANPVVSETGTRLISQQILGAKHLGGEGESFHDWLLKPDTYYLFGLQNISGATVDVAYSFDWTEVSV